MGKTTLRLGCLLALLMVLFCAPVSHAKILVVAPHPDDDIVFAAGVTYKALGREEPVKIVYMTNGDFLGVERGYVRQDEAVTAQAYLGGEEENLIFLGYPDGYLSVLLNDYPEQNDRFTSPHGQSTTYANRGLGGVDYHTYKFGTPGDYNSYNMILDLVDIVSDFKPDHILVPSEFDYHPDHAATYELLKFAIESVHSIDPDYAPTIHKTIVWWHTWPDWPNPIDPTSYYSEIEDIFSRTGLHWNQRESLDVPLLMQLKNYAINLKYLAMDAHESEGGATNFLGQYIHKDEFFWTENSVGSNQPPVPNAGFDQIVNEDIQVQLDGSGSFDPEGSPLLFQWVQVGGEPVELSDPAASNPSFVAPSGLWQNETLTFELTVNDGQFGSLPDSTNILVIATNPINQPPVAVDDNYYSIPDAPLIGAAPGVLGNDTDPEGATLTAVLVSGPSHGTCTLNLDGSFSYTPTTDFVGIDSFAYMAFDGTVNSDIATVTITVFPPGNPLFSDSFTRAPGAPNPLSPWSNVMGTWTVTNGALHGSSNPAGYAFAQTFDTPAWTDIMVEGNFRFPAGAFGGGLGGRVNPATGARYCAWIYPDGSDGGSNQLKLVKTRDWINWNGIPIKEVSLPSVGTGWHSLKMLFEGGRIQVFYDGTLMIDFTDNNYDSREPYLSGGISAELYTDATSYVMDVDNVIVSPLITSFPPVAVDDAFSTSVNTVLNQAAPGVLGNDTDAEGSPLTAQLASGPSHGSLTLNDNGSFTYTPNADYVGSDSFTYRASDGTAVSNLATVTISVISDGNAAPIAVNDAYSTSVNTVLNQAAPGVLGNDTDAEGSPLTAQLASGPSHGSLTLNSDGSFTYTPNAGYVGSDSFTYRASDGTAESNVATVALSISASGSVLYADDFSRAPGTPNPLSPWVGVTGTWTVDSGVLRGSSALSNYGFARVEGSSAWTDYTLEGRIRFPAGAFGGGLGGRVNPATGAHYGAWVYPDGSVGGANTLKLVKFNDWTDGTLISQVNLPSVGTGWHSLKLVFTGNRIQVYYDGTQRIDVTDTNIGSRPPYLSGGISADLWTFTGSYVMQVDDIAVNGLP